MELLIGCGNKRDRRLSLTQPPEPWRCLVTLDMSPDTQPDIVHDLEILPYPLDTSTFDEIHAYEVLEHTGKQGDWRFFFAQFDEFARILKPNGKIFMTVPVGNWIWGDPGHTRYLGVECFTFLLRREYAKQVGRTPMTDYRSYFKSDWDWVAANPEEGLYVMRNLKE